MIPIPAPTYKKLLIISDPHFDLKPINSYRWKLFEVLPNLISKYKPDGLAILGDLTDAKDNHPAKLVNEITDYLICIAAHIAAEDDSLDYDDIKNRIVIVMGNHDGIDYNCPFFRYLGQFEQIVYANRRASLGRLMLLPHTRDHETDWMNLDVTGKIVLTHVTVDGAIAETGKHLGSNIKESLFKDADLVLSGDIHKPQTVGCVNYVGAPYHTRFGDDFDGGCVLLDVEQGTFERIPLPMFPRKTTLRIQSAVDLKTQLDFHKDVLNHNEMHVKVRLHLNHNTVSQMREIKTDCKEVFEKFPNYEMSAFELIRDYEEAEQKKSQVDKPKTSDYYDDFCKKNNVPDRLKDVGQEVIAEIKANFVRQRLLATAEDK